MRMIALPTDKQSRVLWISRLLNLTTIAIVLTLLVYRLQWFNPWHLSVWHWSMGAGLLRVAISLYDHGVVLLIECYKAERLPTRRVGTNNKPVRYVDLDNTSIVFLTINALHEWVFVQNLCHFLWTSDRVQRSLSELGLFNTVGTLYTLFVVQDLCYAPLHQLLHQPFLYPYIHKHHHRQHYPTRGYLDAGNEHPIEHVMGVGCTWAALYLCCMLPMWDGRPHALTVLLFFNMHAALAMLNHSPYNVQCHFFKFFHYSVGNHEMHHRKFTVNYGQYCMWYDHLVSTFAAYEGPNHTTDGSLPAATDKKRS